MNIERFKVFSKVAQFKSFTRAADELFMTQPAISKNIKLIEDFYGVVLFRRIGKHIELTEAGNKLLQFANEILKLADEAKEALNEDKLQSEEKIVISSGSTVGVYILPEVLKSFLKKYPKVQFTIEISNAQKILDEFVDGSIDVGIIGALVHKTSLKYLPFISEELKLIVAKHHPWCQKSEISASDLKSQPFFLREKGSGLRYVVEERLRKAGIELDNVTEMPNNEAIVKLVEAGLGVSIVSEYAIAEDLELNRVKTVKIKNLDLHRYFYLLYNEEKMSSKTFNNFIDYLRTNCTGKKPLK
ncbi:selenium metabolism-associated LysR family transcriptional regulator [Desulfoscipio gibsoniae]|uniref:Transcriptional regulator n=1 Tax=Desulfoscipio gibsoniae DSM 7213 TaxID=767817 RepID=R4KPI1_9FIRM|nr:selenium metabolism-associated LysR family transcriptional regulator [Desulfoscipio gibsoniae]AGL03467.1 transcriptional regulator [Desulfoscipio gibsoniae DSM 7213]